MGRRGPKQQPTTVKLARGTHRSDRHGDPDKEPKPDGLDRVPKAPAALATAGRKAWRTLGPELLRAGLLSRLDLAKFELLCAAYDEAKACQDELNKAGRWLTTDKGYVYAHPAVAALHRCLERLRRLAGEFGMSPSDRSGLQVDTGKKQTGVQRRSRA